MAFCVFCDSSSNSDATGPAKAMILVPTPSTATSDVVVSTIELTDPNTVVVRVAWDARVAFLIHDDIRACDGCAPT